MIGKAGLCWIRKRGKMEKDRKEKELLFSWAERSHIETDMFPQIEKECGSYFIKETSREYLEEYQFEGVEEIRNYLEKMSEKDERIREIEQVLLIAAMKNKPRKSEFRECQNTGDKDDLPVYIYNF